MLLVVTVIALIRRIHISLISIQDCEGTYTVIIGVERSNGMVRRLSGAGPIRPLSCEHG